MAKVAFIGAGSLVFSRRIMIDMLTFEKLGDTHFALMDIDEKRLAMSGRIAERVIRESGTRATFETTGDRTEALKGADYVVIMILHGGIDVIRQDIDIPMTYGVSQCIGDTLGPGGVFRALRTIPAILDICYDIEALCPDAIVLNYTNPMAMLCWAATEYSDVQLIGLCHSVQGTTKQLAEAAGVPYDECAYHVAGINHQAWVLQMHHGECDLYPDIFQSCLDGKLREDEPVRSEMCQYLRYFVTEGSGHNSEYLPWFRKRKDLLEKWAPEGSTWKGEHGFIKKLYGEDRTNWDEQCEKVINDPEPIKFEKSLEYGSAIINGCEGGAVFRFNGNVPNLGLITNLPDGCCVEVPCFADVSGIHPTHVGDLPPHLAAVNRSNIAVQELTVEAATSGDREAAFHAIALDPLTAAVCSLEEIQAMVNEMFEAEAQWLPQFA
jgi:alpha-galactosidase